MAVREATRYFDPGQLSRMACGDDRDWTKLFAQCFGQLQTKIRAMAREQGAEDRDYATTLIVTVASPELLAVGQVGDGAVVVTDSRGELQTLSAPVGGEHAGETVFLTSDEALATLQVRVLNAPVRQFALFTDGLQMLALKLPAMVPHAPFFQPLFRFAGEAQDADAARSQLEAFLQTDRVAQRTDDDLTLVLGVFDK